VCVCVCWGYKQDVGGQRGKRCASSHATGMHKVHNELWAALQHSRVTAPPGRPPTVQ
jgi:hypothetical protein